RARDRGELLNHRLSPMRFLLALPVLAGLACASPASDATPHARPAADAAADTAVVAQGPVRTGAAVLAARGFDLLAGKRVGLIVNHTARVDTAHLADLVAEADGV